MVGLGCVGVWLGVVRSGHPWCSKVGLGQVWLAVVRNKIQRRETVTMATASKLSMIDDPTNDAERILENDQPYRVEAQITGVCPYLFHRWSVDGVEAKSKAAKGSKAKKEDDLESYVYRNEKGFLCVPAEQFRMSIVLAAKFKQDPRSPRKSAMDLFKAAIFPTEEYCSLGKKDWDYVDRRRVMIQRNGITRHRPAILGDWKVTAQFQVVLPEYIAPAFLNEVLQLAGRIHGVGDFRPTFGRYQITGFKVLQD